MAVLFLSGYREDSASAKIFFQKFCLATASPSRSSANSRDMAPAFESLGRMNSFIRPYPSNLKIAFRRFLNCRPNYVFLEPKKPDPLILGKKEGTTLFTEDGLFNVFNFLDSVREVYLRLSAAGILPPL